MGHRPALAVASGRRLASTRMDKQSISPCPRDLRGAGRPTAGAPV